MSRDNPISIYVSDDEESAIKAAADSEDMSISAFVRAAVLDKIENHRMDDLATEARVENRLNELMTLATENIEESAERASAATAGLSEAMVKDSIYSVALIQLMAEEKGHQRIRKAIYDGSQVVADNWDVPPEMHQSALEGAAEDLDTIDDDSSDDDVGIQFGDDL